jgi:hypothetical protein
MGGPVLFDVLTLMEKRKKEKMEKKNAENQRRKIQK